MKIILDNFIIECDKELDYIDEVVKNLKNETSDILDFFKLSKLKDKKTTTIYTSKDSYKKHMLQCSGKFK